MKLSEYIEILKTFPPGLDVYTDYDNDHTLAKAPTIQTLEISLGRWVKQDPEYPDEDSRTKTVLVLN